jgi:hypothetical protein
MASLLVSLLLTVGQAPGPETRPTPAAPRATTQAATEPMAAATAIDAFKAEAAEYIVRLDSRPREKLAVEKDPVLRWSNPARTGEDGALFVWTLNGRPELIGTIFTYRLGDKINRKHEFHSLALEPLAAEFRGAAVWTPRAAGITFAPLPKAPAVAANARQRLTQMKAAAREFTGSMKENDGEQYQLRLLTQPLFRYEPKSKELLDGAIFAYSLGTDPEVLLLLEARAAGEGHAWQFAFARFHYVDLTMTHGDRKVWHVDALPDISNLNLGTESYRDHIYTTYHVQRGVPAE